ncbi:hypothetical protein LAZ67_21002768, partial [Cordylochernes scorpioides]
MPNWLVFNLAVTQTSLCVRTERQSVEDYKLSDQDIVLPKDIIIQFPIHAIHYQKDFYPEPEKFDPERFLPENRDKIRPFTYLPFGAGPRNCIAERFALLEIKLCLAKVIRSFVFHRVPETSVCKFIFVYNIYSWTKLPVVDRFVCSIQDIDISDDVAAKMVSVINGGPWKRIRSKMSPTFSSGKMRKMAHLINECAETTCKNLAEISETKKPYNIKEIFGAFTMDVIATTAFGTKLDSHHDPDNPFVKNAQKAFNQEQSITLLLI